MFNCNFVFMFSHKKVPLQLNVGIFLPYLSLIISAIAQGGVLCVSLIFDNTFWGLVLHLITHIGIWFRYCNY